MMTAIKTELKRAFKAKLFCAAIIAGIILAVAQLITIPAMYCFSDAWSIWQTGFKGAYPQTVWNSWMGATPQSVFSTVYFFIAPIIVCVPFAGSLFDDIESGYAFQIISRTSRRQYIASKIIATFLAGGTAILIPLAFNLLVTAALVPLLPPTPSSGTFPIAPYAIWADLYYQNPLSYLAIYSIFSFAVAGVTACIALPATFMLSNRFVVVAFPFILSAIVYFAGSGTLVEGYSPINLFCPYQPFPVQLPTVILIYAVLFGLSISFLAVKSNKMELR